MIKLKMILKLKYYFSMKNFNFIKPFDPKRTLKRILKINFLKTILYYFVLIKLFSDFII